MTHPLLRALRTKTPALGVWLTMPSVHTARQIALAGRTSGLNWMCIDCEHGLTALVPGVAETIAAVTALPPPKLANLSNAENQNQNQNYDQNPSVLVRVPAPGIQHAGPVVSHQIKQALDAGAHGVIVPMVANAEMAREVALDARFPPTGRRGFGSPYTHQTWGIDASEYLTNKANDEIIVCVQIESREAVHNLEEIAQTQGVDVLFIGPFDLSLALGYPTPNPEPHPEVERVIQRIKEVAHKHHKKVAFYCTSGDRAKKRADDGFDMVNMQSDVGSLVDGLTRNLAAAWGSEMKSEDNKGY